MMNVTNTTTRRARALAILGVVVVILFLGLVIVRRALNPRGTSDLQPKSLSHYRFKMLCENTALPVTMQEGGTCWCYAATSLMESEIFRLTGKQIKLSEPFFIRKAYFDKARHYLLRQGHSFFDEGADSHDVLLAVGRHGIVPASQYSGLAATKKTNNSKPLHVELEEQIKPTLPLDQKHPSTWRRKFDSILDHRLGVMPTRIEADGLQYSATEYRDSLKIEAKDYVLITSYTHAPFYAPFVLELLGNYANFQAYNLPIDEWEDNIQNALESGFTASFDCDVSEPFFLGDEGVAILPDHSIDETKVVSGYIPECSVTQDSRQDDFEASRTTDDHQLHAIGIATDEQGTRYIKLKNSWGTQSGRDGYVYMSIAYMRSKVLSVLLHRDGLCEESRARLYGPGQTMGN